jgi:IclR family transcriptional regulator, KDG regulon repressor
MTPSSAERPTYRVQVLERAVDILQVLAEDSRELTAGEVAERLSLHKSTIHRLLMVLDHQRLIRRNTETGRYALGLRLFEFGTRAVRGLRLRDQAQPHLDQLARETGETAHICVFDRTEMVSIAYAEGPRSLRMPATVGRRTPVYCSAVGKAMLAFLPQSVIDDVVNGPLRARTEKTLVTREALLADLRQVRIRGYAVDNEEIEKGLRCVGAPVWNYTGEVVAAISVAGPAFRVTKSRVPAVARAVLATTRGLSTELGYRRSAQLEVPVRKSDLMATPAVSTFSKR